MKLIESTAQAIDKIGDIWSGSSRKKNILCHSTRAFSGREGELILRHFKFLEQISLNIDLLSKNRTEREREVFKERIDLDINEVITSYTKFYSERIKSKKFTNWLDVYDCLPVGELEKYEEIYIIGGIDLPQNELSRFRKRKGRFPDDGGQINFGQVAIKLINVLAILKAHNEFGTPIKELVFDPCELSLDLFHESVSPTRNYQKYHGYDIERYSIKRLDSHQYFQQHRASVSEEIVKEIDFCFGYTVLKGSNREKYVSYVNDLAGKSAASKIFTRNYQTNENSLISFSEYDQFTKRSRFTLILPAYDESSFSIYRFLDALEANCLPLIHPGCNVEDVNKSFGVDLNILKVDKFFSEQERVQILSELKTKFEIMTENTILDQEIVSDEVDLDSLQSADINVSSTPPEETTEPVYLKKVRERTLNKIDKSKAEKHQQVFTKEIQQSWNKSIEGILEVGMLFSIAKEKLNKKQYRELFNTFTLSNRTVNKIIAIYRDPRIRSHVSQLPSSWATLYKVTRLEDDVFERAIESNEINPNTQRRTINALLYFGGKKGGESKIIPDPQVSESTEYENYMEELEDFVFGLDAFSNMDDFADLISESPIDIDSLKKAPGYFKYKDGKLTYFFEPFTQEMEKGTREMLDEIIASMPNNSKSE